MRRNTFNDNRILLTDEQKRQRKTIRTLARQAGVNAYGWNVDYPPGSAVWLDDGTFDRRLTYPEAIAYLTGLVEGEAW